MTEKNHSQRGPIGHDWTEPFGQFINEISGTDKEPEHNEHDEEEARHNHINRMMSLLNQGEKINEPSEAL